MKVKVILLVSHKIGESINFIHLFYFFKTTNNILKCQQRPHGFEIPNMFTTF